MTHRIPTHSVLLSSLLGLCACNSYVAIEDDGAGGEGGSIDITASSSDTTGQGGSPDTTSSSNGAATASSGTETGTASGSGAGNVTGSGTGGGGATGTTGSGTAAGGHDSSSSAGSGGGDVVSCQDADPNEATGQKCPLYSPCDVASDCGINQGCQNWECSSDKTCALQGQASCDATIGEACQADVVIRQLGDSPVDKDFLAPDGSAYRHLASMAFEISNHSGQALYLSKLKFEFEGSAFASPLDVSALNIYKEQGSSEHVAGNAQFVCGVSDPFNYTVKGLVSECNTGEQVNIPANGTMRFLAVMSFAKDLAKIAGHSYRLRIAGNDALDMSTTKIPSTPFNGSHCGVPAAGFDGAWLHAKAN